jgi:hypothetical protein
MNADFALINRAMENIANDGSRNADRINNTPVWETAKQYYLSTMLETLEQVEWTGAKRRRELAPMQMPCKKNPEFAAVYLLPVDCAKPVELDGKAYFKVEGELLYTDAVPARLLYVSNGRQFYVRERFISGGNAQRRPFPNYVSGGDSRRNRRIEHGDGYVCAGNAETLQYEDPEGNVTGPPHPAAGDDFPEYYEPDMEPNFWLYLEFLLSSKYAARLTDKEEIAAMWFAKAREIGRTAQAVSLEQAAGRRVAAQTWQEELGIN